MKDSTLNLTKQILFWLILSTGLLIANVATAQYGIGGKWHFGNGAGLDFFQGSSPIALNGGQTYLVSINPQDPPDHAEGTTSIADSTGNLLFYSNGEKVWDGNHQVLPNGNNLMGDASSTQSSLIVPLPGSLRYFYLFTTDSYTNNLQNGFRYSIIDRCLNNGKGDIIPGQKNILIENPVSEKLAAVRHFGGEDYWIMVHEYGTSNFKAYLLTANGLSNSPVTSTVGTAHNAPNFPTSSDAAVGEMKFSPDGSKIAYAMSNRNPSIAELFDFDNLTGIVSNPILIASGQEHVYGVAFGAESVTLYLSYTWNPRIEQYDLLAPNILASKYTVAHYSNYPQSWSAYGMQLGPDYKLYVAKRNSNTVSVIANPDLTGVNCNYISNYVSLNGNQCSMSLPNFIAGFNYEHFYGQVCNTTTSTEAPTPSTDWQIGPNPFSDQALLTFDNPQYEAHQLSIYTPQGQQVRNSLWFNDNQYLIRRDELATGIYFFCLKSKTGIVLKGKLLIQ